MTETATMTHPLRVRTAQWVNRGWEWFLEDLGMNIVIAAIAIVIAGTLPFLIGPVSTGWAAVGLRKCRLRRIEIRDFFEGFGFFIAAFLSSVLIVMFAGIGLLFLIIPGVVILVMYMFSYHFIVDRGQDFWQAMESSRRLVSGDYFGFVMFGLLLAAINLLGLMLMGIGVLVTWPVTWLALTAAYDDCVGRCDDRDTATGPIRID